MSCAGRGGRYALCTMCIGVGQGIAMIIETRVIGQSVLRGHIGSSKPVAISATRDRPADNRHDCHRRRPAPHHRDHRPDAQREPRLLRRRCSACASSSGPSTSTTRASITSTTATRPAAPGTVLTFFAWERMGRGRPGVGEASLTQFALPQGSLEFWRARLEANAALVSGPALRFGEELLLGEDPDGLKFALVAAVDADGRAPSTFAPWSD